VSIEEPVRQESAHPEQEPHPAALSTQLFRFVVTGVVAAIVDVGVSHVGRAPGRGYVWSTARSAV